MSEQINISRKNVEGRCDLKCAYNFNYTSGPIQASNGRNVIRFSFENRNTLPVTYNKKKYRTFLSGLHYPSQLLYNDQLADAEIFILHVSEDSTQMLAVYIPIKISNDTSSATTEITNIIRSISVSAPSPNQMVTIPNINLQNIVPKKPFFSFSVNGVDAIAFNMLDAISISNSNFETLKQIITPNPHRANMDPTFSGLFFNSSGPNTTTSLGDGIYISCNPTGNSTETEDVSYDTSYDTNVPDYDTGKILEDPTFILVVQTIIACMIFIIIFYVWNYGYKFIDGDFGDYTNTASKS